MMKPVKSLTVSGFRGIYPPLTLDFEKGNSRRSMVIYGKNGTGKSSITDAWEWLYSGTIQKLAREGAGEGAYPHVDASPGDTWVQCDFSSEVEWDRGRLDYDFDTITKPKARGQLNEFRQAVRHRCQVRIDDLTRFVYQRKAERYDNLAELMGFSPQVEFQKGLKSALNRYQDELTSRIAVLESIEEDLVEIVGGKDATRSNVIEFLNGIYREHELDKVENLEEVSERQEALTERVEKDPRARKLSDLADLLRILQVDLEGDVLGEDIEEYVKDVAKFEDEVGESLDLFLFKLYRTGEEVLEETVERKGSVEKCPLCDRRYDGDLLSPVREDLGALKRVADRRSDLESRRDSLLSEVSWLKGSVEEVVGTSEDEWEVSVDKLKAAWELGRRVVSSSQKIRHYLSTAAGEYGKETIERFTESVEVWRDHYEEFEEVRSELAESYAEQHQALSEDEERKKLVENARLAEEAIDTWEKYSRKRQTLSGLQRVGDTFEVLVDDYIDQSMGVVEKQFDRISDNVERYFNILERDADSIDEPRVSLKRNGNRAVLLQIEFHGDTVDHAYTYLSESQLNSFGLAVFLASVRQFNDEFKFIILDDVVSSFDAYKRPRVIELLKQEFSDTQLLVLTHDRVWFDRITDECPSWIKKRFVRYSVASGPVVRPAKSRYDEIQDYIDEDRPGKAGRLMGQTLERDLQDIGESFEMMVKYNRQNEYSLKPLITRFRVRVKDKLGSNHEFYQSVENLVTDTGFRNFVVHWKNPETPISPSEVQRALDKWLKIRSAVKCSEDECYGYLQYDSGAGGFVCRCGETELL